MKITRLIGPVLLLTLLATAKLTAATTPVELTGWNADVVSENSATSFSTGFDGGGSRWFEAGLMGHSDGLPSSRQFASTIDSNIIFQFQPYTSNNCLRLDDSVARKTGTLVIVKPSKFSALSILAVSAGGSGTGTVTLNFSDGTSSTALSFLGSDWYAGTNTFAVGERRFAIAGLGRLEPSGSQLIYQKQVFGFGMHQTDLDLVALGLDGKAVKSLAFTKPTGNGAPQFTGIFAVSGAPASGPRNEPNCVPAPRGLLSWWTGDNTANDIFGNNPGVTQGGTSFADGKVGRAFRFNGVDGFVSVAPFQSLNALRNNLTVMAWFQYEGFGKNVAAKIFSKRVPGGYAPFEINLRNDGVVFSMGSTTGNSWNVGTGETQLTPRVWYHAAFVVDSGNVHSFYVNGQRRGVQQQLARPLMTNAAPFLIGTCSDGFLLAGLVDEVAIFDRALTAAEIQMIYSAGSAGLCRAAEFVSVTQINREQVEFKLKGLTGKDVTIYSTSNFLDWLPVLTLPNADGVLTLVDPAAKSGWRFYRASTP